MYERIVDWETKQHRPISKYYKRFWVNRQISLEIVVLPIL